MAKSKHIPVRSPLDDVLSASIPKQLKRSVQGRAAILERPMSILVRKALEYHEQREWQDVEFGILTPKQKAQLNRWLASDAAVELISQY